MRQPLEATAVNMAFSVDSFEMACNLLEQQVSDIDDSHGLTLLEKLSMNMKDDHGITYVGEDNIPNELTMQKQFISVEHTSNTQNLSNQIPGVQSTDMLGFANESNQDLDTSSNYVYVKKFPKNLWLLVDHCENGAVRWAPDGKSLIFNVPLMQDFLRFKETLSHPVDFKSINFDSFKRQLNNYGFYKCDTKIYPLWHFNECHSDLVEYKNPLFVRDMPHLLGNIQSKKLGSSGSRRRSQPQISLKDIKKIPTKIKKKILKLLPEKVKQRLAQSQVADEEVQSWVIPLDPENLHSSPQSIEPIQVIFNENNELVAAGQKPTPLNKPKMSASQRRTERKILPDSNMGIEYKNMDYIDNDVEGPLPEEQTISKSVSKLLLSMCAALKQRHQRTAKSSSKKKGEGTTFMLATPSNEKQKPYVTTARVGPQETVIPVLHVQDPETCVVSTEEYDQLVEDMFQALAELPPSFWTHPHSNNILYLAPTRDPNEEDIGVKVDKLVESLFPDNEADEPLPEIPLDIIDASLNEDSLLSGPATNDPALLSNNTQHLGAEFIGDGNSSKCADDSLSSVPSPTSLCLDDLSFLAGTPAPSMNPEQLNTPKIMCNLAPMLRRTPYARSKSPMMDEEWTSLPDSMIMNYQRVLGCSEKRILCPNELFSSPKMGMMDDGSKRNLSKFKLVNKSGENVPNSGSLLTSSTFVHIENPISVPLRGNTSANVMDTDMIQEPVIFQNGPSTVCQNTDNKTPKSNLLTMSMSDKENFPCVISDPSHVTRKNSVQQLGIQSICPRIESCKEPVGSCSPVPKAAVVEATSGSKETNRARKCSSDQDKAKPVAQKRPSPTNQLLQQKCKRTEPALSRFPCHDQGCKENISPSHFISPPGMNQPMFVPYPPNYPHLQYMRPGCPVPYPYMMMPPYDQSSYPSHQGQQMRMETTGPLPQGHPHCEPHAFSPPENMGSHIQESSASSKGNERLTSGTSPDEILPPCSQVPGQFPSGPGHFPFEHSSGPPQYSSHLPYGPQPFGPLPSGPRAFRPSACGPQYAGPTNRRPRPSGSLPCQPVPSCPPTHGPKPSSPFPGQPLPSCPSSQGLKSSVPSSQRTQPSGSLPHRPQHSGGPKPHGPQLPGPTTHRNQSSCPSHHGFRFSYPSPHGPQPFDMSTSGPQPFDLSIDRLQTSGRPHHESQSYGPSHNMPQSSFPSYRGPQPVGPLPHGLRPSGPTPHGPQPNGPSSHGPQPYGLSSHGHQPFGPSPHGPHPSDPTPHGPHSSAPTPNGRCQLSEPSPNGQQISGPTPHEPQASCLTPHDPGSQLPGPTTHGPPPSGQTIPARCQPSGPSTHGHQPSGPTPHGPQSSGPSHHGPQSSGHSPHGPQPSGHSPHGPQPSGPSPHGPRPSGPSPHWPQPFVPSSIGPQPSGPLVHGLQPTGPSPQGPRPSDPLPKKTQPSGPIRA